ncbi:MAG: hypothetical protein ACOX00_01340 [Peptoniphilaceae bacterium]|jgi:hypothetical protein
MKSDLFRQWELKQFSKTRFFILTIVFRLLMDFSYVTYISQIWDYMGFFLVPNGVKILVSYLFLILFTLFLSQYRQEKFSHFLLILLFYSVYLPIGSIYGLQDMSTTFFAIATLSFVLLTYFLIVLTTDKEPKIVPPETRFTSRLMPLLHLLSIYVFLAMTLQNTDNINPMILFDLDAVYAVRERVSYGLGMSYFFGWQTKVINPFLIGVYYHNKNRKMLVLYLALQLWLYLVTGHKQVLFLIFVVFVIMRFSKWLKDLPGLMAWGFTGLMLLSNIELAFRTRSFVIDYFIRRVLFLPALISNYYYNFFSEHGFQYWSYSIVGRILQMPKDFPVEPPYLIGQLFFGNPKTNAVNSYLGTDYMNGGVFGVLFATVLIIITFRLIDRYAERIGRDIVLITLIGPVYTLWNTGILTAFLTGGLFFTLVVLESARVDTKEPRRLRNRAWEQHHA